MAKLPSPSTSPRSQDHIFVSYSSKDRAFVDRLAQDLRSHGHVVWIDIEGIRGGDQWRQSIADGLHFSAVVLVVLSPDSVVSEWVEEEVKTGRDLEKKIIPLLLRPIDDIDIKLPSLAWLVRDIQYRDITGGYDHQQLLEDLPKPEAGVPGHCQHLIAELAAEPWGLEHYIQEEAKILPLDASPYEDGIVKKQRDNLMQKLWDSQRMIVLGEPGVGKTVALKRLAWELASSNPIVVPITVPLLEYDGQPLLEWIRLDLVRTGLIRLRDAGNTRDFLTNRSYQCYFLLDGLNEVRPAYHDQVIGEMSRLALEYPWHQIVVTSRIQDDGWEHLRQSRQFNESLVVQPIQEEQALRYLTAHLGDADGTILWEQLDVNMRGLASTPLILWLLKEAWIEARTERPSGDIRMPENRGELYQNFVARMLRRDDERQLNQQVAEEDRLKALRRLAIAMHLEQAVVIDREKALKIIGDDLMLDAILVNGLLTGKDQLRFAPHQTIQEHFAARALQKGVGQSALWQQSVLFLSAAGAALIVIVGLIVLFTDPSPGNMLTLLGILATLVVVGFSVEHDWGKSTQHIIPIEQDRTPVWLTRIGLKRGTIRFAREQWWAETFIQLAGLADDPNHLARRLATINPWLALWCVEEGRSVDPATENIIRQRSINLIESRRVTHRRDAALALSKFNIPERVVEPLSRLILDRDSTVLRTALSALLSLGEQGEETFQGIFDSLMTRLSVSERAEWSRLVSELDPRPGVGLREDGIPYIHAVEILDEGVRWIYQDEEHDLLPTLYVSRYPITCLQFQAFIHDPHGWKDKRWWQGLSADEYDRLSWVRWFTYWNHPQEMVSWYGAMAFCRWLSWRLTDKEPNLDDVMNWPVRLMTEQEWEKAARGTKGLIYPYGNNFDAAKGNTNETGIGQTTAVGIFPDGASPYGVMDMSGNVWEWCLTKYGKPDDNSPYGTDHRALRGGSWHSHRSYARAAYRGWGSPYVRRGYIGFRVVLSSPLP